MTDDLWDRFEAMLGAHAPDLLASLRPPANEAQIAATEAKLGVTFPAEVRCAYLRHDGSTHQDGTQQGWFFTSSNWWACLEEMEVNWEMKVDVSNDARKYPDSSLFPIPDVTWDDLKIAPVWWSEKWIPIGHSMTGPSIYIDLDPAPKGTIGQLINDGGMQDAELISNSLDHYLESLIKRVESGLLIYRGGWMWTATNDFVRAWNFFDDPRRLDPNFDGPTWLSA
jgi:cell wall assembly regulator SMI1